MADSSKTSVLAAIAGNSFIFVAKSVGFVVTGSAAMLSEVIHTFADLLNQILLFIGITRSEREADAEFPVGYGRERYIWALISAVGIFFLLAFLPVSLFGGLVPGPASSAPDAGPHC